ncbi:hypothetical protein C8R44DRAFT_891747 [Mycena epipterygia]|nr:hypothetical protein C8R44DRAFT_891747 [Mycena epipterygia]
MEYPDGMAYPSGASALHSVHNVIPGGTHPESEYSLQQLQQFYTLQQHQAGLASQQPATQPIYQQQQYYEHPLAQHGPVINEPVITREQNYPPPHSTLAEIQNTMLSLQAQITEANRSAEAAKAAAELAQGFHAAAQSTGRKQQLKTKAKEARMQALVQCKMRWSVGIGGRDIDGRKIKSLPHPLQPGQTAEMLEDRVTKKTYPNWHHGVSDPVNERFCHETTKLCMETVTNDTASNNSALYGDASSASVLKMSKRFYGSLRKTYAAQTTDRGAERLRLKQNQNKRRSRKHEKADDHRKAVPRFRELHGEENTVGDYDAIQTDDMSSEHSDCGKVTRSVFEAHRKKAGGGDNGWEVRKKHWHSSWLDLYFAHLKTIRRDMIAEAQEGGTSGSLMGKHRVPRFKGLRDNESANAPNLIRKKPLYESMVSTSWMQATGKTYTEVGAVADPTRFTLFTLKLETTGLNVAEIEYLADDES